MRLEHADFSQEKGWLYGPWNSNSALSIGYANKGIDEPHIHGTVTEIYLVGQGSATVRVNDQTVSIGAGDVLQVDPGEAQTFISNTEDYFHFVIHHPGLTASESAADKKLISRNDLGL
jgi:mannose-6-phosphate isomerase-like protein (cupin superfamily)